MSQLRDIMRTEVRAVSTDATVEEAIRILVKNHISGMPVVDGQQNLVGIVSEFRLLEALFNPEVKEMFVGDVMSKDVIIGTPEMSLSDATSQMVLHRIRRLPVVSDGRLVGIVSRHDLLRYVLETGNEMECLVEDVRKTAVAT